MPRAAATIAGSRLRMCAAIGSTAKGSMAWTIPTVTPNSFHISGSGASVIPAACNQVFTTPSRRSSVTQANARASTDTHNGSSTPASSNRCTEGRAWTST